MPVSEPRQWVQRIDVKNTEGEVGSPTSKDRQQKGALSKDAGIQEVSARYGVKRCVGRKREARD